MPSSAAASSFESWRLAPSITVFPVPLSASSSSCPACPCRWDSDLPRCLYSLLGPVAPSPSAACHSHSMPANSSYSVSLVQRPKEALLYPLLESVVDGGAGSQLSGQCVPPDACPKRSFQNHHRRKLRQMREQPRWRKARWMSARRSWRRASLRYWLSHARVLSTLACTFCSRSPCPRAPSPAAFSVCPWVA